MHRECALGGAADLYKSVPLHSGDEGRRQFALDRAKMLSSLKTHLRDRFLKVLDTPVINACSVFDHRKWPAAGHASSDAYGAPEISLLMKEYAGFFTDTTQDEVLKEWSDMMECISESPGLVSRKFNDLWSWMIVQFTDDYPKVLRLVAIMLLMPLDTSECERLFSLMNGLKTHKRERLDQQNLRNLMAWKKLGDIPHENLPWLSILHEFKLLAGESGRHSHSLHIRSATDAAAAAPRPEGYAAAAAGMRHDNAAAGIPIFAAAGMRHDNAAPAAPAPAPAAAGPSRM